MSTETRRGSYPLDVDKKLIEEEYNHMASMEGWQEGSSGLPKAIDWKENTLFNSAYEAIEYIDDITRNNSYEQLAIKYKDFSNIKKTKAMLKKEEQLEKINSELYEMRTKKHFENHKAEFITCKDCGSKINKKYIRTHTCPLCGSDLRSETDKNKEIRLKERKEKAQSDLDNMKKKAKDYEVKWMVQVQFHV